MQTTVVGQGGTPQPSLLPSCDKLNHMEDTAEKGMYVGQNANVSRKSQYGGESGVPSADTVDQDGREEPVEEQGLYSSVSKQQEAFQSREAFYSHLGEPDLRDLPSLAYQVSQGMVSEVTSQIITCISAWPFQWFTCMQPLLYV